MVLMDRNTQPIVVQGYGDVFDCTIRLYFRYMIHWCVICFIHYSLKIRPMSNSPPVLRVTLIRRHTETWMKASRCAWICIMILTVYVSTTVVITQVNCIGYVFRLLNVHLQAHSLQVKSQNALHTWGSQCVYISKLLKPDHLLNDLT